MLRRFPIRAGRNDDKWCASSYPIDRVVLADVRKDIEGLQQTFNKQKTAVEKLLPEIALLKRQVKMLEDVHNKSVQNSWWNTGVRDRRWLIDIFPICRGYPQASKGFGALANRKNLRPNRPERFALGATKWRAPTHRRKGRSGS